MRNLSDFIVAAREEKKLTQTELARRAGVARSTLNEIESNTHGTTVKTAKKILRVLTK